METFTDIKQQLVEKVEDFYLSQAEKHKLHELIENVDYEKQSFLRNRAFDMARTQLLKDETKGIDVLRWLEQVVKLIDKVARPKTQANEVFFSPGDACRNQLRELFHSAQECVDVCVFTISDDRIREAIEKAHMRSVKIRILTDNDKTEDKGSDIDYLISKGITVVEDNSPYHMHHKFAVFDQTILVNGSFNWTRSASRNNEENIVVLRDKTVVDKFQQQFETLWKSFS